MRCDAAHHVRHWADGGETSLANTLLLCSAHHRLVHEGGYRIRRDCAGQWFFQRPDGRAIPARGYRPDDMCDDGIDDDGIDDDGIDDDGIAQGLDGIDQSSCRRAAERSADECDSSDDSAESSKYSAGKAAHAPVEGPLKPGKEKAPYEKGLFPLVAAQNDA